MAETEDSREKQRAYKRQWMRAWVAAHREEYNAYQRKRARALSPEARQEANARKRTWRVLNQERRKATDRAWRAENRMREAYLVHKAGAKRRNIAFLLTFAEWTEIWLSSGKWDQRGTRRGQFVMARFGDAGPYAIGNVRICSAAENLTEVKRGRQFMNNATRKRISEAAKARDAKDPDGAKARAAHARTGRQQWLPMSEETRRKISDTLKARPTISEETRSKLRAAQQARRARERAK